MLLASGALTACSLLVVSSDLTGGNDPDASRDRVADEQASLDGRIDARDFEIDANAGPSDAAEAAAVDVVTPDSCSVTSSGPRYGTVVFGPNWSTPDGIRAPDNDVAHSAGATSPIVVSGFGFTIPSTSTIMGIAIDIARTRSGGLVTDSNVALSRGTSAPSPASWPEGLPSGPYVKATYGGASHLWGATWKPSDVNAAAFSVMLSVTGDGDGHVDSIGITVYYCP